MAWQLYHYCIIMLSFLSKYFVTVVFLLIITNIPILYWIICSFNYLLIHSSIHSSIHPFIHPSFSPSTHPSILQSILSCIHFSCTYLSVTLGLQLLHHSDHQTVACAVVVVVVVVYLKRLRIVLRCAKVVVVVVNVEMLLHWLLMSQLLYLSFSPPTNHTNHPTIPPYSTFSSIKTITTTITIIPSPASSSPSSPPPLPRTIVRFHQRLVGFHGVSDVFEEES